MENNKFLAGNILREVRNGRLNCNNAKNETHKMGNDNATYVKKIRRNRDNRVEVFPYASTQNQKKAMKDFAALQGESVSFVKSVSSTEASSEGNPYKNWDEDVMGFMSAKSLTVTSEEYEDLSEKDKIGYKKQGKKGYKKNITKKRRAKLMMSPLQAIGHTRITQEFCTRQTDDTPILFAKEVYSTNMSAGFMLDVANIGRFNANDVESDYRDYNLLEAEGFLGQEIDPKETKEVEFELSKEDKLNRIETTLEALRVMSSNTTMANNLEDLSARFVIMAEYNIGSSVFSGIFGDNELKIDFLKQAIEENERYRTSDIFIGVREEFMNNDGSSLADTLRLHFADDDKIKITGVSEAMKGYMDYLKDNLV